MTVLNDSAVFNDSAIDLLADCVAIHGDECGKKTFIEIVTDEATAYATSNDDNLTKVFKQRKENSPINLKKGSPNES